jgi:endonuclease/exonuclease/phosphatase family metal-dependent hydrolase
VTASTGPRLVPAAVPVLVVVLVLLAGCASPGPTSSTAPLGGVPPVSAGAALRVMTWNVRTSDFDPADWAPVVAAARPDVLGLQEICAGEAVALAELLRRDHGLAYEAVPGPVRPTPVEDRDPVNAALRRPCRDGAVVQYGLAVLTRLPVTTAATELFAPDHRDEQRGYQRLVLEGPGGAPLTVLNAHLGLAGVARPQIRDLAAAAAGPGPTVVVGDLNTTPDDGALAPLRAGFAEVDPVGRLPTSGNRPDTPGGPARHKVDYIFHRGPVAMAPPDAPWVASSDHRPLVATLR